MTNPAAKIVNEPDRAQQLITFEQPLTERMRTFLRLEFLFRQAAHHSAGQSTWEMRAAVSGLLEILAILTRGDIRKDVLHELERYANDLENFRTRPGVDNARLAALLTSVQSLRDRLNGCNKQLTRKLADCEFLSSVRHRSAIPGGTCEFDLPDYSFWLSRSYTERRQDFDQWMDALGPLREAVNKLLWLTRESAESQEQLAIAGMYQQTLARGAGVQLLRVALPQDSEVFPEISGNQHRFTVRFQRWRDIGSRPTQTSDDTRFLLTCC
ncbi:MAG: cell division protein ZapD [Gammaproteobacteria bacterium]|nr:cell division protein ZapD [Gammaproteobacteria bacterium]NND59539.1 cell division protein ZapD [Gammaproteobacteria bacterium]